jgi:presenilin-like A22 family membrane protease
MDAVMPQRRVLASNAYNISWQGAWAVGAALGGGLIALGGALALLGRLWRRRRRAAAQGWRRERYA